MQFVNYTFKARMKVHKTSVTLFLCVKLTERVISVIPTTHAEKLSLPERPELPWSQTLYAHTKRLYLTISLYRIILLKTGIWTATLVGPLWEYLKFQCCTLVRYFRSIVDCSQVDNGARNLVNFVYCAVGWGTVVGKISSIKHRKW
jgi:hypothetical protein